MTLDKPIKKRKPKVYEFLKMLSDLFDENRVSEIQNDIIDINEFIMEMQILLQDRFNGEINNIENDTLSVTFTGGEQFEIKVTKRQGFPIS